MVNIPFDIVEAALLGLIPLFTLIFKVVFKPSRFEIKIITQIMSFFILVVLKWIKKRKKQEDIEPHVSNIKEQLHLIKVRLTDEDEALG
jgi:hypothetical protein